jgi:hypothetical protein
MILVLDKILLVCAHLKENGFKFLQVTQSFSEKIQWVQSGIVLFFPFQFCGVVQVTIIHNNI